MTIVLLAQLTLLHFSIHQQASVLVLVLPNIMKIMLALYAVNVLLPAYIAQDLVDKFANIVYLHLF